MKNRFFLFTILLFAAGGLAMPVHAQAAIQVTDDRTAFDFPTTITFSAEIKSSAPIKSVVLEYGGDELSCGSVTAEAYPDFTPSADVKISWTWDLRQTGYPLPPGAKLWWDWRVSDASGAQFTSPRQTSVWLDSQYPWQTLSGGNIDLHWYQGNAAFGQALHDAAVQALARLTQEVGVGTDKPVDLYIYASTQDVQAAVLFQPSWMGGKAFPEWDIVIIGIPQSELDWGKATEAHELTHVLVDSETFSCLSYIPTWLDEGLAMVGQGGPDTAMQATFDDALAKNSLASIRSLTGSFPEPADQADLAYGESYSIVNFLIQEYGRDKINALLMDLKNGDTTDQALQKIYGFDVDGLEDAWRAAIGAAPRTGAGQTAALPTATIIPTIAALSGVPVAAATAPPVEMTPTPVPAQPTPAVTASQTTLGLIALAALGCLCVIVIAVIAIVLVTNRRNKRTS